MKIIQFLLDKIVVPLAVGFLPPIVFGVTSKATTGNWTTHLLVFALGKSEPRKLYVA